MMSLIELEQMSLAGSSFYFCCHITDSKFSPSSPWLMSNTRGEEHCGFVVWEKDCLSHSLHIIFSTCAQDVSLKTMGDGVGVSSSIIFLA